MDSCTGFDEAEKISSNDGRIGGWVGASAAVNSTQSIVKILDGLAWPLQKGDRPFKDKVYLSSNERQCYVST